MMIIPILLPPRRLFVVLVSIVVALQLAPGVASQGTVVYPPPNTDSDGLADSCRTDGAGAEEVVHSSWRAGDTVDIVFDVTIPDGGQGQSTFLIDYNGDGADLNEVLVPTHNVGSGEQTISVTLDDDRACTPPNSCRIQWILWDGDREYTSCIEVDIHPADTTALPYRVPCDFAFNDLLDQESISVGDEFFVTCSGCTDNANNHEVVGCPTDYVSPSSSICLAAMLATGNLDGDVQARVIVADAESSYESCTVAGVATESGNSRESVSLRFPDAGKPTTQRAATTHRTTPENTLTGTNIGGTDTGGTTTKKTSYTHATTTENTLTGTNVGGTDTRGTTTKKTSYTHATTTENTLTGTNVGESGTGATTTVKTSYTHGTTTNTLTGTNVGETGTGRTTTTKATTTHRTTTNTLTGTNIGGTGTIAPTPTDHPTCEEHARDACGGHGRCVGDDGEDDGWRCECETDYDARNNKKMCKEDPRRRVRMQFAAAADADMSYWLEEQEAELELMLDGSADRVEELYVEDPGPPMEVVAVISGGDSDVVLTSQQLIEKMLADDGAMLAESSAFADMEFEAVECMDCDVPTSPNPNGGEGTTVIGAATSGGMSMPAMVGIVVGGLAVIVALIVGAVVYIRRRRNNKILDMTEHAGMNMRPLERW